MSDNSPSGTVPPNGDTANPHAREARPPFPAIRLFYAIGFGIVAYIVVIILFAIGGAQFVVVAINGKVNDELKSFSASLVQYLWELLAFITFVRDSQPFPIGPFPKTATAS